MTRGWPPCRSSVSSGRLILTALPPPPPPRSKHVPQRTATSFDFSAGLSRTESTRGWGDCSGRSSPGIAYFERILQERGGEMVRSLPAQCSLILIFASLLGAAGVLPAAAQEVHAFNVLAQDPATAIRT